MTHYLVYLCESCEKDMLMDVTPVGSLRETLTYFLTSFPTQLHNCCDGEMGVTKLVGVRDHE